VLKVSFGTPNSDNVLIISGSMADIVVVCFGAQDYNNMTKI
jgi:hypothetical protein